ncbi:ATPase [Ilyonectria robusta]
MANGAQGGLESGPRLNTTPSLEEPSRPHHHLGDSCSTSITAPCEEKWPSERESEDQGADKNEEILDLARRLTTQSHAARNLNVYGFGTDTDFQKSVGNIFLEAGTMISKLLHDSQKRVDILRDIEGVLHSGEMLAVLGPPGSGCSTFLKTIAGDTHGFHIDEGAELNYSGIHPKEIRTAFRGEAIYTAEVDQHFAHLTVGDTLYFAARARCPRNIPAGITPKEYAEHLRDVTMAMFGISHTRNTRVGDDFADVIGCTSAVAIYQASQDAYDVFDKVLVLYQGRQIFFGKTGEAKAYFERLGFVCPEQQTTADFLTSMTNHQERIIRPGWENKTPRSPDEFAQAWKKSAHRQRLLNFVKSRKMDQSKSQRAKSPFTLSYLEQMSLTLGRSWSMLKADPSVTITMLCCNLTESLVVASIFYNLPENTGAFFKRGFLILFIMLMNVFNNVLEILTLYAKRNIVEKHGRYALYHPSAKHYLL